MSSAGRTAHCGTGMSTRGCQAPIQTAINHDHPRNDHKTPLLWRMRVWRSSLHLHDCTDRHAQLPLQGLPAVERCPVRIGRGGPECRPPGHGHACCPRPACQQRHGHHPQLLRPVRHAPVHPGRFESRLHVDPLSGAGRAVLVPAPAGHLGVERSVLGMLRPRHSAVSAIATTSTGLMPCLEVHP